MKIISSLSFFNLLTLWSIAYKVMIRRTVLDPSFLKLHLKEELLLDSFVPNGLLLIDGDNLRGKAKFELSKDQLCKDLVKLIREFRIVKGVVLYFDHGFESEAHFYDSQFVVAFSGMPQRADDVIARDIPWFINQQSLPISIVTEDMQLRRRCRKSVSKTYHYIQSLRDSSISLDRFQIISSLSFLKEVYGQKETQNGAERVPRLLTDRAKVVYTRIQEFKKLLDTFKNLQGMESDLLFNAYYTNPNNSRNKQLLKDRITLAKQQLLRAVVSELLDSSAHEEDIKKRIYEGIIAQGSGVLSDFDEAMQSGICFSVENEETWERMIRAELLRLKLAETKYGNDYNENTINELLQSFVAYYNRTKNKV